MGASEWERKGIGVRAHAGKGAEPSFSTQLVHPHHQGDIGFPKAMTN